jgi:methylenetetrahydrofolate reductase (NADPH)
MCDELAAIDASHPVLPGIMPVVSVAGLVRMSDMNKTMIPADLLERLEAVADEPDEVRRIGVDVCTELGQALLDAGAPGLHLYALNRSASVLQIVTNLGLSSADE